VLPCLNVFPRDRFPGPLSPHKATALVPSEITRPPSNTTTLASSEMNNLSPNPTTLSSSEMTKQPLSVTLPLPLTPRLGYKGWTVWNYLHRSCPLPSLSRYRYLTHFHHDPSNLPSYRDHVLPPGLFGDDQSGLVGNDQFLTPHSPSTSYGCHAKFVTLGTSHPQSFTPTIGLLTSSEGTRHDGFASDGSRKLLRSFLGCWEESGSHVR
jgi:hypothetical protein